MTVTFKGRCCADCLQLIAHGEDPGDVAQRILDTWTAAEVSGMVAGDEEYGFSWAPCEACERPEGGERYGFAILESEQAG